MTGTQSDDATEPPAASDGDVSDVEARLADRGEPYARATVVRREPPVSANVGDRGVVTADGELHGWVGGAACAQSVVASAGRAAVREGEPRLVGIAPDPEAVDRPGLEAFPMTCHSEGVLEVFVEPVVPTRRLVVVGGSPVARTLARLADELALETLVVDPDPEPGALPDAATTLSELDPEAIADAAGPAPLFVVASMGEFDARGLAAAELADAPYLGLVASDKRAAEELERAAALVDRPPEALRDRLTNPAGVDVDARTPAELAASLLAEVVDARNATGVGADAADDAEPDDDETATDDAEPNDADHPPEATDPVCGMTVDDPAGAPRVDHGGESYYFCCHGCADSFRADPDDHLDAGEVAG